MDKYPEAIQGLNRVPRERVVSGRRLSYLILSSRMQKTTAQI